METSGIQRALGGRNQSFRPIEDSVLSYLNSFIIHFCAIQSLFDIILCAIMTHLGLISLVLTHLGICFGAILTHLRLVSVALHL